ncbi:hypothetical protein [Methanocella sp. MCL-LM]|uniref:hypothetical protein n=1 Tax=Methanocella sp. MCL-LM TaxID=3412035 RepID=UPI003C72A58C
MRLRVCSIVLLLALVLIISSSAQSVALSMPSITGDYKLKGSSPIDDPATSVIEVQPGQEITVDAIATLTYSGIKIRSPPIYVTTYLRLLEGGSEIASARQTTTVDPMLMENGKTYTKSGSGKITVPSDAEPGTYKLKCNADAEASMLGQTMTRSAADTFTVQVLESPQQNPNSGGSSGDMPEKPVQVTLKRLLKSK